MRSEHMGPARRSWTGGSRRRKLRVLQVLAAMVGLAVMASPASAAEEGGVDAAINGALEPVATWAERIVFFTIPLGDEVELPLIVAWLVAGAVFFTVYLRFINIRGFRHSIDVVRGKYDNPDDEGETSHFQALMTALSATVGLGNIAGVAVAISIGGPGATFWMVVSAFFGMSMKFTEASLAVKYRTFREEDGHVSGGPMYYIREGLLERGWPGWLARFLAGFFAVATIGGALGAANMFQSNQAYNQFLVVVGEDGFFADKAWVFGLAMAAVVAVVILGGIRSIARVTEKLVPFMAIVYLSAAAVVLVRNAGQIPTAFSSIVTGALTGEGVAGGFIGALVVGFQRGAFSNEAGLGSAAIAHSSVKTDKHIREGFTAQLGPFIDTIVVCTATALVIVISGVYENVGDDVEGVSLTSDAFETAFSWFPTVLAVAVILFAFSTMISWSYYGVQASNYLFGDTSKVDRGFQVVFCIFIVIGASLALESVVPLMDSLIFLMPLANLVGLYALASTIKRDLGDYWGRYERDEMPVHDG